MAVMGRGDRREAMGEVEINYIRCGWYLLYDELCMLQ